MVGRAFSHRGGHPAKLDNQKQDLLCLGAAPSYDTRWAVRRRRGLARVPPPPALLAVGALPPPGFENEGFDRRRGPLWQAAERSRTGPGRARRCYLDCPGPRARARPRQPLRLPGTAPASTSLSPTRGAPALSPTGSGHEVTRRGGRRVLASLSCRDPLALRQEAGSLLHDGLHACPRTGRAQRRPALGRRGRPGA